VRSLFTEWPVANALPQRCRCRAHESRVLCTPDVAQPESSRLGIGHSTDAESRCRVPRCKHTARSCCCIMGAHAQPSAAGCTHASACSPRAASDNARGRRAGCYSRNAAQLPRTRTQRGAFICGTCSSWLLFQTQIVKSALEVKSLCLAAHSLLSDACATLLRWKRLAWSAPPRFRQLQCLQSCAAGTSFLRLTPAPARRWPSSCHWCVLNSSFLCTACCSIHPVPCRVTGAAH
jgi:hypothetical protein